MMAMNKDEKRGVNMKKNNMLLILLSSIFIFAGCQSVTPSISVPTTTAPTTVQSTTAVPTTTITNTTTSIPTTLNSTTTVSTTIPNQKFYTITWKNYDGSILDIDENVVEGSIPVYKGQTPTRSNDEQYMYVFNGWTPSVTKATKDEIYTATYTQVSIDGKTPGVSPVLSNDGKTVEYGFYPQTNVKDEKLIQELNALTDSMSNGWYLYNGEYYAKTIAKVYNNEAYTFNNGMSIQNDKTYWFKCETIKWNIISSTANKYTLLSSVLLDAHSYYDDYYDRQNDATTIYANNYKMSDIRSWLNNDFFNEAFMLNNSFIIDTIVDNGQSTTDDLNNKYTCDNTTDKVFLPSYKDYINESYGFENNANNKSDTRVCKTTDYARARGAWYNANSNMLYNGSYWTRSPSSEFYYASWNVNTAGYLSTYVVDGSEHCVRPSINIIIE